MCVGFWGLCARMVIFLKNGQFLVSFRKFRLYTSNRRRKLQGHHYKHSEQVSGLCSANGASSHQNFQFFSFRLAFPHSLRHPELMKWSQWRPFIYNAYFGYPLWLSFSLSWGVWEARKTWKYHVWGVIGATETRNSLEMLAVMSQ